MSEKSNLEREILEQPQIIQNLIQTEQDHIAGLTTKLKGRFNYILIAARGTSDNAARYAQYLFQIHNEVPVALATPSVFSLYEKRPNLEGALVLAISQSGMSPDILSVLKEGHRQGRPTLAVTNNPESPLAEIADDVIPLHAGIEKAVAATKTYTNSLVAMALLSLNLAQDTMLKTLMNEAQWVQQTLDTSWVKTIIKSEILKICLMRYWLGDFTYCTAFVNCVENQRTDRINTTVLNRARRFLYGLLPPFTKRFRLVVDIVAWFL